MGFLSGLFGGPSPQEEQAQAQMATTSKNLAYDSFISFGEDQSMFKSISNAITPVLVEGPGQFGMPTAQEAAERSMLSENLSSAEQQESQMVNESLASRGVTPGAGVSPGALAEIEGAISQKYAVANATGQLQITDEGYNIGRQNFWNAETGSQDLAKTQAGLTSDLSKTSVDAGTQAFSEANTINSQKQGFMKALIGVGGDIAGAFVGDPMLGNQLDTSIYGAPAGSSGAGTEGLGSGIKSIISNFSGGSPTPSSINASNSNFTSGLGLTPTEPGISTSLMPPS